MTCRHIISAILLVIRVRGEKTIPCRYLSSGRPAPPQCSLRRQRLIAVLRLGRLPVVVRLSQQQRGGAAASVPSVFLSAFAPTASQRSIAHAARPRTVSMPDGETPRRTACAPRRRVNCYAGRVYYVWTTPVTSPSAAHTRAHVVSYTRARSHVFTHADGHARTRARDVILSHARPACVFASRAIRRHFSRLAPQRVSSAKLFRPASLPDPFDSPSVTSSSSSSSHRVY